MIGDVENSNTHNWGKVTDFCLFKSFMGIRITVYEEDIWNFIYVFIFRKFLYSDFSMLQKWASVSPGFLLVQFERFQLWLLSYVTFGPMAVRQSIVARKEQVGEQQQRARDKVHSLKGVLLGPTSKAQPSGFRHLPTVSPDYNCIWLNPLRSELFWFNLSLWCVCTCVYTSHSQPAVFVGQTRVLWHRFSLSPFTWVSGVRLGFPALQHLTLTAFLTAGPSL